MKRALTQSQASELLRAASLLPPAAREQFMREVDARLAYIRRRLTDDDVGAAIISTLSTLNVTTSHMLCDEQPRNFNLSTIDKFHDQPKEATMARHDDDDFDERGILKDGRSVRTSLLMMDAMMKDVAKHDGDLMFGDRSPLRVVDAYGGTDGLSRPGPRYAVAGTKSADGVRLAVADVNRRDAYRQMVADMENAWRPPAPLDKRVSDQKPALAGRPRIAVTDADFAACQRIKDAAYAAMVAELEGRKP